MSVGQNLLGEPDPTLLPENAEVDAALRSGEDPATVAAAHPTSSAAWAGLAEDALDADGVDRVVAGYAYARVGYHRGLDALRRNGWKGHGPVPWSHPGNQGFLRCLAALARAATSIQETDEAARCAQFLRDCDPKAFDALMNN